MKWVPQTTDEPQTKSYFQRPLNKLGLESKGHKHTKIYKDKDTTSVVRHTTGKKE